MVGTESDKNLNTMVGTYSDENINTMVGTESNKNFNTIVGTESDKKKTSTQWWALKVIKISRKLGALTAMKTSTQW